MLLKFGNDELGLHSRCIYRFLLCHRIVNQQTSGCAPATIEDALMTILVTEEEAPAMTTEVIAVIETIHLSQLWPYRWCRNRTPSPRARSSAPWFIPLPSSNNLNSWSSPLHFLPNRWSSHHNRWRSRRAKRGGNHARQGTCTPAIRSCSDFLLTQKKKSSSLGLALKFPCFLYPAWYRICTR